MRARAIRAIVVTRPRVARARHGLARARGDRRLRHPRRRARDAVDRVERDVDGER